MSHFYFDLQSQEQFDLLTKHSKVCVLDFYTKWCGPCKALAPVLEKKVTNDSDLFSHVCVDSGHTELGDIKNKVVFVKINVEEFEDLSGTFQVSSIPHIAFYSEGVLQKNIIMGNKPDDIINTVKQLISS